MKANITYQELEKEYGETDANKLFEAICRISGAGDLRTLAAMPGGVSLVGLDEKKQAQIEKLIGSTKKTKEGK